MFEVKIQYLTIHLRLITFDTFNSHPGHVRLTVPDSISIYTLSKMIIDETSVPVQAVSIFRDSVPSNDTRLNPMYSLKHYDYIGISETETNDQLFPIYILYYDYSPMDIISNCPILKCDYYMK